MWIFMSNSFISVVQKPGDTNLLTVRARIEGDIERVFPDAKVQANKGTDYKYRAKVPREAVAKALHDQAMSVSYPNFKSTVKDRKRHDAYMGVWSTMHAAGDRDQ
jgi:hypothetical protein